MPKVSVIMSVFNGGSFLSGAIESILSQSFSDFEFIIINDGSTDNSLDTIEYYAEIDQRILVVSRENRGIFPSLNEGLKQSTGQYIAIVDADDVSDSRRLSIQSRYLDDNYRCCVVGVGLYSDEGNKYWFRRINTPEKCKWGLLFFSTIGHPGAMLRRSSLVEAGITYDNSYGFGADYKLWCALADIGEIHLINKPLVFYRRHENAVSTTHRDDQEYARRRIQVEQFKKWLNIELPSPCASEYKEWAAIVGANLFQSVTVLGGFKDVSAIHWAFQEFSARAGWGVFITYFTCCLRRREVLHCLRLRHLARVLFANLGGG